MAKHFQVDTGGTLTTGLKAYYKLEDVTEYYVGGGTEDFTNNGSVAFNPAKVNNGADFGATNGAKYLFLASNLGINGTAISMAAWVNITTAPTSGNWAGLLSHDSGSSGSGHDAKVFENVFYHNNAGTYQIRFQRNLDPTFNDFTVNYTLTPGTWYFIVFTYDGTTVRGYVNNVSQGSVASSGNGTNDTQGPQLLIGATEGDVLPLSGLIDELGVWSKALSTQEITDLYNGGSGQTMVASTTYTQNITQSATGSSSLAKSHIFVRALSKVATSVVGLSRLKTAVRTLTQLATSVVSLGKHATHFRALTQSATASVTLAKIKTAVRSLTQVATSVVSLSKNRIRAVAISATVTASVALSRIKTASRILTQSAAASVAFSKLLSAYRTFSVSASASVTLSEAKLLFHTITQVASSAVSLSKQLTFVRTLTASATATLKMFLNGLQSFFGSKFTPQGTAFSDKYAPQGTTFTDKYQKQNTVFDGKYQ